MSYHLFIQSSVSQEALQFAKERMQAGEKIAQVYFYEQGVFQAKHFADQWRALPFEPETLKICQTYAEKYQIPEVSGFVRRGLVDFFVRHWQDQGKLIQFL
jgi:sulfur relay (sulfurtransferase) complex TusBCD TusD component (DsrE family)